jgi:hypothetical protein
MIGHYPRLVQPAYSFYSFCKPLNAHPHTAPKTECHRPPQENHPPLAPDPHTNPDKAKPPRSRPRSARRPCASAPGRTPGSGRPSRRHPSGGRMRNANVGGRRVSNGRRGSGCAGDRGLPWSEITASFGIFAAVEPQETAIAAPSCTVQTPDFTIFAANLADGTAFVLQWEICRL